MSRCGAVLALAVACACSEPPPVEPGPRLQVVSVEPANGATGVSAGASISAVFDAEVDPESLAVTFSVSGVSGAVRWSPSTRTATFVPDAPLPLNQVLTATLASGLRSTSGATLGADYSWSFDTNDRTAPTVLSTNPADGAKGIALTRTVEVTFSEPMDPATLTAETLLIEELSEPPGRLSATVQNEPETSTARLTPAEPFDSSGSYRVTVTTGAKDRAGNPLAAEVVFAFETELDEKPPKVELVEPADGATNVPTDAQVRIRFDERLDPATVTTANLRLSPTVASTIAWDAPGRTAVLAPSGLVQDTLYTAQVSGVRDLTGNVLTGTYSWTFRTARDQVRPVVVSTEPANGAADVPITRTEVTVTFSEVVQTFTGVKVERGTVSVGSTPTFEAASRTLKIPISERPLVYGATYRVTVDGVRDLAGNTLEAPFVFSFQAEPDKSPPAVKSIRPANGARLVAVDTKVTVVFDDDLDPATVTSANLSIAGVTATVAYDASTRTATLSPAGPLSLGTEYTVSVGTGIEDLAGLALAAPVAATFRTIPGPALPISGDTRPGAESPRVAFDAAGNGIAAWELRVGDPNSRTGVAYALYSAATSSWSANTVIQDARGPVEVAASSGSFAIGYRPADPTISKKNVTLVDLAGLSGSYILATTEPVKVVGNESQFLAWWYDFTANAAVVSVFNGFTWSTPLAQETGAAISSVAASRTEFALALRTPNGGLKSRIWNGSAWTAAREHLASSPGSSLQQVRVVSNGGGFLLSWVQENNTALHRNVAVWDAGSWKAETTWTFNTQGNSFTGLPLHTASNGVGYMAAWFECPNIPSCVPTHFFSVYEAGAWTPKAVLASGQDESSTSYGLAGGAGGYLFARAFGDDYQVLTRQFTNGWGADVLLSAARLESLELSSVGTTFAATYAQYDAGLQRVSERGVRRLESGVWGAPAKTWVEPQRNGGQAVAADGQDLVLVHSQDGVLHARRLTPTTVTAPVLLSNGASPSGELGEDLKLVIADDGSAFAAWTQFDLGASAAYGAHFSNGAWSAPMLLGSDARRVDVAVDGSDFLALLGGEQGVYARRYSNGALSPLVTLDAEAVEVQSLAVAGGGGYAAIWFKWSPWISPRYATRVATSADGLTWTSPTTLHTTDRGSNVQAAAMNGTFAVAYGYSVPSMAAVYSGGSWSNPVEVGTRNTQYRALVSDGTRFHLFTAYSGSAPEAWRYEAGGWLSSPLPNTGDREGLHVSRNGNTLVWYRTWNSGTSRANLVWNGSVWSVTPAAYVDSAAAVACDGRVCLGLRADFSGATLASTLDDATPSTVVYSTASYTSPDASNLSAGNGNFGVIYRDPEPSTGRDRIWVRTGL